MTSCLRLKLIVLHNHFRPGGVRRVIELAAPHIARVLRPRVTEVVLVGSDTPEDGWLENFETLLAPLPVTCKADPALGYLSEQRQVAPREIAARLRVFLQGLLDETLLNGGVVWAHNHGLGRNLPLTRELDRACAARNTPLIFHHHDWWFDNRWQRWPEMRQHGFRSLSRVAATIFPPSSNVRHMAINQADAAVLEHHFPQQSGWLPNPASDTVTPDREGVRQARHWLGQHLGHDAPVWLMPCRLLRRKNVGEALLIARWLRPEAWLVTTAAVTSPDEEPYANRLNAAAVRHRWPLRLNVLNKSARGAPRITELIGASEAVLLTSLQEGFGLSYIEAAVGSRPLIARNLPNIAPDLAEWGLRFPQSYDELLVHTALFDRRGEEDRQKQLFSTWRDGLPSGVRRLAGEPMLLAMDPRCDAIPFSRLTLTAQLEVLAHPAAVSWAACAALNPQLGSWRDAAAKGSLGLTSWPAKAVRRLSGGAFARRFAEVLNDAPAPPLSPASGAAAQLEFIRDKLRTENLYPLTWSPIT